MDKQPEILSFVKAMASADRLRIVGLLSQGSKRGAEIAEALGMHSSDANRHLEQLTGSGVVSEADGVYNLNEKAIESLARGHGRLSIRLATTTNSSSSSWVRWKARLRP